LGHRRKRDDRAAIERLPFNRLQRARATRTSRGCARIRRGEPQGLAVEVASPRLQRSGDHCEREEQVDGPHDKGTRQPSSDSPICSKHAEHSPFPWYHPHQRIATAGPHSTPRAERPRAVEDLLSTLPARSRDGDEESVPTWRDRDQSCPDRGTSLERAREIAGLIGRRTARRARGAPRAAGARRGGLHRPNSPDPHARSAA
jgi:hypothetical protein